MAQRARSTSDAPDGLVYEDDFIDEDHERALLSFVESLRFERVELRGQIARRSVRHFGARYVYDTGEVSPSDPMPNELAPLRERAAALIAREPTYLGEALVTRYPPGAGIGWHRDAPGFGSRVVGISLGAPCRMRFRRTTKAHSDAYELVLRPRSVYVLAGAARASWQHSIPPVDDLRYSLTFRSIRDEGGAVGDPGRSVVR